MTEPPVTAVPPCLADLPPHGKRVLVIDDSLTVRLFCRKLLEEAGFVVAEAVNGLEGLEQALQDRFDLFAVDINMPKMDGYGFLREARRQPALAAVPAVMLSTEAADHDIARAFEAGANFCLVKPIEPDRFTAVACALAGVPCR